MNSVVLAISLLGIWFGSPSDGQLLRKGEGRVMGQFVLPPVFEGAKVYRHHSRWTVCGLATGQHVSGRTGPERFIVDRKTIVFSGDPAFAGRADDKAAFETLWKNRCSLKGG